MADHAEETGALCKGISTASEVSQGIKRPHDENHVAGPLQKSPCTVSTPEVSAHRLMEPLGHELPNDSKMNSEDGISVNYTTSEPKPRPQRKSWRRSSRGRRSLPAFSSNTSTLCESISLSIPDHERLEALFKAAMQTTVKRMTSSLYTLPAVDTDTLQTQIESLNEDWDRLAKDINKETLDSQAGVERDPAAKTNTARIQEDINRLQAECASWESLLNKHRIKTYELHKCVERGEEKGVPLDPSCFAKSSQSQLILSKPDYTAILSRQQKLLQSVELVMNTKCCIMRELLSFHDQSKLMLKETSARLASNAGFQNLSSSPVKQLIKGPMSSV